MLKISFTNAEVSDHGYGLEVNGKSLEDIISTALGTKLKGNGGYGSGLPSFSSNSSPEELRGELGDRIASRVLGSSQVVEITSGDRRGL